MAYLTQNKTSTNAPILAGRWNAEQFDLPFDVEATPCPFEFLHAEAAAILVNIFKAGQRLKWHITPDGRIFEEISAGQWVKIW